MKRTAWISAGIMLFFLVFITTAECPASSLLERYWSQGQSDDNQNAGAPGFTSPEISSGDVSERIAEMRREFSESSPFAGTPTGSIDDRLAAGGSVGGLNSRLVYDPAGIISENNFYGYSILPITPNSFVSSQIFSFADGQVAPGDTFAIVSMPGIGGGKQQAAAIVSTLPQTGTPHELVVYQEKVYEWVSAASGQDGSWREVVIQNPNGPVIGAVQTNVNIDAPEGSSVFPDGLSSHRYDNVPVLTEVPVAAPTIGASTVVVFNNTAYKWVAVYGTDTGTWEAVPESQVDIGQTIAVTLPGESHSIQVRVGESAPQNEPGEFILGREAYFYADGHLYKGVNSTEGLIWTEVPLVEETPDFRVMQNVTATISGLEFRMVMPVDEIAEDS